VRGGGKFIAVGSTTDIRVLIASGPVRFRCAADDSRTGFYRWPQTCTGKRASLRMLIWSASVMKSSFNHLASIVDKLRAKSRRRPPPPQPGHRVEGYYSTIQGEDKRES